MQYYRISEEGLAGIFASRIAVILRARNACFGALLVHSSLQMG